MSWWSQRIYAGQLKYARARAVTGWNIALDWNFGPNMYTGLFTFQLFFAFLLFVCISAVRLGSAHTTEFEQFILCKTHNFFIPIAMF